MSTAVLTLAYEYPKETVSLFTEYTAMLVQLNPGFQAFLDLQRYVDEIQDLTVKYGLPGGRLYLAWVNGQPAGCIALRKLDEERCELKRLYVRPAYRRQHIALQLVNRLLDDARALGYRWMLLDTLPELTDAIRMYRNLGFQDVPRYNDSPLDDTVFLGLEL